jgi:cytidylate kinase
MPDTFKRKIKVAIDGPAGAGKSTVAREIARRLGCSYLDTGAMYRAVTLKLIRERVALDDLERIEAILMQTGLDLENGQRVFLDGEDVTLEIRQPAVSKLVSPVAAIPAVRSRMVALQREIASRSTSIVMDGRDIASRVMPDADYSFYLDATPEERARRRQKELMGQGLELPIDEVTAGIEERDRIDSARADSPLVITPGALVIDTTEFTFKEVVALLLDVIRAESGCAPDAATSI